MDERPTGFGDLLTANREFAASFGLEGLPAETRAGVAVVTCMDCRIDPLSMLGLRAGDANVLRNPGGRVTEQVLAALVLAVQLLGVRRILVVEHTRCAVATESEEEIRRRLSQASGEDVSELSVDVIDDQEHTVQADVARVRAHPLLGGHAQAAGFLYDVDTGLLHAVGDTGPDV